MPLLHTNRESLEGVIEVTSTSRKTGRVEDIPLRDQSDFTRLVFAPTIVTNDANPENSVCGKLVYERKGKNDELFPSQRGEQFVSKQTIHKDDALEIELDTSEVRALFRGLRDLYKMYDDVGSIEVGTASYIAVNDENRALLQMLSGNKAIPQLLNSADTLELIKALLKLLTQGVSHGDLRDVLSDLENGNIHQLSTELDLEMLKRASADMRANLANGNESYWQSAILEKYPWVLSHVFSTPCVLFESKAYVGGKALDNKNGHEVDFIYQNELSGNVSLVEIKTPCTPLLGGKYRNDSYSVSSHLSGAVTQILSYKQSLLNELASLRFNATAHFEAFSPKCVILIGSLTQLNNKDDEPDRSRLSSFENFRNSLNGISILTFDELLRKIDDLITILSTQTVSSKETSQADMMNYSAFECDEGIPF